MMVWKHLAFQNAPFSAGFLEIILNFLKCQNAPLVAVFWALSHIN